MYFSSLISRPRSKKRGGGDFSGWGYAGTYPIALFLGTRVFSEYCASTIGWVTGYPQTIC